MVDLLRRDKYKVLEGMCTEHIFTKEVLSAHRLIQSASTNWWVSYDRFNQPIFFNVQDKGLSDIDYKVMEVITKRGLTVYYVYLNSFNEIKFVLANLHLEKIRKRHFSHVSQTEEEFIRLHQLKPQGRPLLATKQTRVIEKQNKAINFFVKENLLKETTLQRYFVNHFLMVYMNSPMNIDGFLYHNNQLMVYEIKFKFPARNGTWGLNIGLRNLFQFFSNLNIPVFHFILVNTTFDKELTALDGVYDKDIKEKFYWIYSVLKPEMFNDKIRYAPKYTSSDGRKMQGYYSVKPDHFKKVFFSPYFIS